MRGAASSTSQVVSALRSSARRALPALAFGLTLPTVASAQSPEVTLPEVNVIGTTPLSTVRSARPSGAGTPRPGRTAAPSPTPSPTAAPAPVPVPTVAADAGMIDRNKVPSNTVTLTAEDFDHSKSTSLADSLLQRVPSVYINDTSVNPFQPDVQYRGFVASPTVGVPQGLAVYQNGVRVNESFGDTVNWDFIPAYAIRRLDVFPSNPVFGLNALGGAISIEMKNGFNYQGREVELLGGSNWRRSAMAQVGMQQGNTSFYLAADALNDNGWRDKSPSELRRVYADVGVLGDRSEFHVNFTGASNFFGAVAATPIQLLNQRWNAIYTNPQTTKNQLAFLNTTFSYQASDTLTIKSNAYYRGFWQKHVDGNSSDVVPCDAGVFPGFLCLEEADNLLFGFNGAPVPDTVLNGGTPGTVDRTATAANTFGGTLQAASNAKVFGHDNNFVVGGSVDRGHVQFKASSELGVIQPDLFVTGTGVIVNQPDGSVAPANVKTDNTYLGLYMTDTF